MAYSKECPIWIRESAIFKLKVTNNISFPEARKLYFSQNKPITSATTNSYAAAAKAPHTVTSVGCQSQTNLTWIDSSIPMQRPSLTLSTKSITTKTNSSCQATPISAFSQPSSDGHSQSAANSASSLLPKIKSTSKLLNRLNQVDLLHLVQNLHHLLRNLHLRSTQGVKPTSM